jgi:hypothetical protein
MRVLCCGLRWVSEVYPFKKGMATSFEKYVELIFAITSYTNDNHHLP